MLIVGKTSSSIAPLPEAAQDDPSEETQVQLHATEDKRKKLQNRVPNSRPAAPQLHSAHQWRLAIGRTGLVKNVRNLEWFEVV